MFFQKQYIIPVLLLISIAFLANNYQPLEVVDLTLNDNSKVLIEGETNVAGFECNTSELEGNLKLYYSRDVNGVQRAEGKFRAKTRSIDCGNSRMNNDLSKALKESQYPEITFELIDATPTATAENVFFSKGRITIAGVSRPVNFRTIVSEPQPGTQCFEGKIQLDMKDFNIEPPVAMFGMVQTKKEFTLHFMLYVNVPNQLVLNQ